MPKSCLPRRTITWSQATDEALLSFLGPDAAKAEDLSEFVGDSVRWRLFDRTVQAVKERNASLNPDQVQDDLDDAVRKVRKEMAEERSRSEAS
jgi:hypothetical protein